MPKRRLICWALVLVTLVLYAPVRSHDFVNYDDPQYVTENRYVNRGFTTQGLVWAFTRIHGESTYWHPLTWLSHMLDCELFGLNPAGHHVVNVVLHALNAALLFLVLHQMTGALWRSAMVAALFAWHPLQVDTVAWVAERKNLLSALSWILAMGAYVRYARRPGAARYCAVLLIYLAGLMFKPILVALPCVLLLLDFWPLKRWAWAQSFLRHGLPYRATPQCPTTTAGKLIVEKLPFFGLAVISSIITIIAHERLGTMRDAESIPFANRLGNAVVSYARYLRKTFWPDDLSVFYPHPGEWPAATVAGGALLLLIISALAVGKVRRAPYVVAGWFWFLGVLVPYSGIVQAGLQAMADRFAYLPLIGLFLGIVWTVADYSEQWSRRSKVLPALAGMTLLAVAVLTWKQLGYWQNSATLFARAIEVTTNNAPAHINLGVALERQGRRDEALRHYQEALRIEPRQPQVHNNIGNVLDAMGRTEEAIRSYEQALRLRPGVALVHNNLGSSLVGQGKFDEAMVHYNEAMRLAPFDPEPRFLAAKASLLRGRPEEAIEHFHAALRVDPAHARTLMHFARLRAAHENPAIRNGAEAVSLAQRAIDASKGHPMALDVLAIACAEIGQFHEAARLAQQAIEYLNAAEQKTEAAEVQSRLELYQSGKPFRERNPVLEAPPAH